MKVFFVNFAKTVSDNYCDLVSRFEDAGHDVHQLTTRKCFSEAINVSSAKNKDVKFIVFIADSRQYNFVAQALREYGANNVDLVIPNQDSIPSNWSPYCKNVIASRDFSKIEEFFKTEINAHIDEKVVEAHEALGQSNKAVLDQKPRNDKEATKDTTKRLYFANFARDREYLYTAGQLRLSEEGYPIFLAHTRWEFQRALEEDKGPRHIFVFVSDSRQYNFVQRLIFDEAAQYVTVIVTYQDSLPGYIVPGMRVIANRSPAAYMKQVEQLVYNESDPIVTYEQATTCAIVTNADKAAVKAEGDHKPKKEAKKDLKKFCKKARKAKKKADKALKKANRKALEAKTKKAYNKAREKAIAAQTKSDKALKKIEAKRND